MPPAPPPPPAVAYLYVVETAAVTLGNIINGAPGSVLQYAVMPDGSLTPLTPASVPTGDFPIGIYIAGPFVYVTNEGDATISQYTITQNGTLQPLSPATVPTGSPPGVMAFGGQATPGGTATTAYVLALGAAAGEPGSIFQYGVASDGALQVLSPASVPVDASLDLGNAGTPPYSLAVVSGGLYLASQGAQPASTLIEGYSINADGSLTALPAINQLDNYFYGMTAHPQGPFAYLITDAGIYQATAQADHTLSLALTVNNPSIAQLAIEPDGKVAYTASGISISLVRCLLDSDCGGYALTSYQISSTGALTADQTTQMDNVTPLGLFADSSSAYVLVSSPAVLAYPLDANQLITADETPMQLKLPDDGATVQNLMAAGQDIFMIEQSPTPGVVHIRTDGTVSDEPITLHRIPEGMVLYVPPVASP